MAGPARFGAYEILHELGAGGMGEVLLGRRRGPGSFEQLVALKTIRPEHAAAPAVRAMFLDEAAIVARVGHPGIAAVHDFGEEGGTLYMALEYVAGISFRGLAELAAPPEVAARAIAEACRGLHAAHEVRDTAGHLLGVVHRDVSPDNLRLGFDGHVKVIDFGIALVRGRHAPVTELGMLKGKPPYMSPEQVKNEAIDRRSDVFSLGVVLHELLAGRPLFGGDSIYAIARAVEHQEILPPSVFAGRSLPPGLDTAVLRALERDPARRTPTAAALAEELEEVLRGAGGETIEAWAARALEAPRERHRRWLAEVVTGREVSRTAIGRATGAVTQLPAAQAAALAALAPPVDPRASTQLPGLPAKHAPEVAREVAPDASGRRGRRLLVALVLAGALGGALLLLLLPRGGGGGGGTATPDAALALALAPPADGAPAEDLPADAAAPLLVDAALAPPSDGPPSDGPRRRPRDAGALTADPGPGLATPPPDAGPAAPPDAGPAPPSAGTGRITIVARGESFLNILVDGRPFQVTPQLGKPIAAGRHTIALLDPKTNQVVYETTVMVEPGQHVRVQPPP